MPRAAVVALSALLGMLLSACGQVSPQNPGAGTGTGAGPTLDDPFAKRAAAVAEAWRSSGLTERWSQGFVPLGPLTLEPDWSATPELKAAFGNGWIRTVAVLPDVAQDGLIRFSDGTSLHAEVIGAHTAYEALAPHRSEPCAPTGAEQQPCEWVTVEGAELASMQVRTNRGDATVPAWQFTVQGIKGKLVRAAVLADDLTGDLPSLPAASPDLGAERMVSAMDLESASGTQLVVTLGVGACDKDPRGLVWESEDAIVVAGTVTPPPQDMACTMQLKLQPVTLNTRSPIGTRPIIDAVTGKPVFAAGVHGLPR